MIDNLTENIENFCRGEAVNAYEFMGAHAEERGGVRGYVFRVWAPCALSVSVTGDFNFWDPGDLPMEKDSHGIWTAFSVYAKEGDRYKYRIRRPDGSFIYKSDPYSLRFAPLPDTSGMIFDIDGFVWHDGEYRERKAKNMTERPVNIYELHAGSWRRHSDGSFYSYTELSDELIPYVKEMGYTHVELLPIMEHPYYPSWGYQVTGYFAPTFRYGSPKDLMSFIDRCHAAGIGVILDWVPAHFPKDESGLYEFDGSCCYESSDPLMNEHPEWNTRIFDYSRYEVRSFLISSALLWIKEYHADGLRVDAVASMLYLDYGRREFRPNKFGGKENLDAIDFLRCLNRSAYAADPSVLMIAEESTAFPMVTRPPEDGGLGFGFKWNMGWMNDMLGYMSTDPLFRKYRHNDLTFSLTYAFSENYILPISHDEVVHCKRSMIEKMPGGYDEKFANLRVFYAYMTAHPGKKLSFMGNEFGQFIEWDFEKQLDWFLLGYESHRSLHEYVRALNAFYLSSAELWENESGWDGFKWICADDRDHSVASFRRIDKRGGELVCIFNFCPVPRSGYRLGLPANGEYIPVFSTGQELSPVRAEPIPMHGYELSGEFFIPGMSASFYRLRAVSDDTQA